MSNPSNGGPLSGVRVLDITAALSGPVATQILGDMGADVIKVEPPEGDSIRGMGPARHHGMGAMFLHTNRSKRSVVLDLKLESAREAFRRLARTADVLICNTRPKAMARLGLDYARLAPANPGSPRFQCNNWRYANPALARGWCW